MVNPRDIPMDAGYLRKSFFFSPVAVTRNENLPGQCPRGKREKERREGESGGGGRERDRGDPI